jgi:phosphoribosylformylglycinamidine synthase
MNSVIKFAGKGGLVIGICNGFQVLMEASLLPGAMMRNKSLKFICKNITVKVENSSTPFTGNLKDGELLTIPIAHADGNYFADQKTLNKLKENKQIVFKYTSPDGEVSDDANPNGSCLNIAGICNEEGNVLGMMPHPERCSESILGNQDGLKIFQSILSANSSRNFAGKSS